jgi:cytochrome oxidase assembly protein ShyY1
MLARHITAALRAPRAAAARRALGSAAAPPLPASTAGTLFLGAVSAATGALGAWQIRRYFWKVDLLAARDEALAAPPLDASAGPFPPAGARAFSRVELRGAAPEPRGALVVEPRVAPAALPPALSARLVAHSGRALVVPLRRADGSRVLAVAGWVPADADAHAALGAWAATAARAAARGAPLAGVLRESETPGRWAAAHAGAAVPAGGAPAAGALAGGAPAGGAPADAPAPLRSFAFVDVPAMAAAAGLSAARGDETNMLLELTAPMPAADEASPWPVTRGDEDFRAAFVKPWTHAVYATTWLSLCAYGAVATLARVRGGRGGRGGERRVAAAVSKGL